MLFSEACNNVSVAKTRCPTSLLFRQEYRMFQREDAFHGKPFQPVLPQVGTHDPAVPMYPPPHRWAAAANSGFSYSGHRRMEDYGPRSGVVSALTGAGRHAALPTNLAPDHKYSAPDHKYSPKIPRPTARASKKIDKTSKERLFICAVCSEKFSSSYSLKRHRNKHAGNRPFLCPAPMCGKRFAETSTLRRHLRTHTGEKPYQCKFKGCGKSFAELTTIRRHVLTHTGEKPYRCPVEGCGKRFSRGSTLRKHMMKKHELKKDDPMIRAATIRRFGHLSDSSVIREALAALVNDRRKDKAPKDENAALPAPTRAPGSDSISERESMGSGPPRKRPGLYDLIAREDDPQAKKYTLYARLSLDQKGGELADLDSMPPLRSNCDLIGTMTLPGMEGLPSAPDNRLPFFPETHQLSHNHHNHHELRPKMPTTAPPQPMMVSSPPPYFHQHHHHHYENDIPPLKNLSLKNFAVSRAHPFDF